MRLVGLDLNSKGYTFTRKLNAPLVGVLENISGFVCQKCSAEIDIFMAGGGEKMANDLQLPFLGKILLDSRICEDSDQGSPFIVEHSDSLAAKAFMTIVDRIEDVLKKTEA
jgi:hypothetical protein